MTEQPYGFQSKRDRRGTLRGPRQRSRLNSTPRPCIHARYTGASLPPGFYKNTTSGLRRHPLSDVHNEPKTVVASFLQPLRDLRKAANHLSPVSRNGGAAGRFAPTTTAAFCRSLGRHPWLRRSTPPEPVRGCTRPEQGGGCQRSGQEGGVDRQKNVVGRYAPGHRLRFRLRLHRHRRAACAARRGGPALAAAPPADSLRSPRALGLASLARKARWLLSKPLRFFP